MGEFNVFKKTVENQMSFMAMHGDFYYVNIDKDILWETYLKSFPVGTNHLFRERTEHDCSACKSFIRNYGNLVAVKNNKLVSIWDIEIDEFPYNLVSKAMSELIHSSIIENKFFIKFSNLGTDKNVELKDGKTFVWEHFHFNLPKSFVSNSSSSIEELQAQVRDSKNVFKRSMDELTLNAGNTILELIEQGSLYRGEEHTFAIKEFIKYKKKYDNLSENEKDNWCWVESQNNPISRIRNTAIGTLLIDISKDVDLDEAITKFEKVMAPTNYKRPNAIFTKRMIEDAQKTIEELGYSESLGRQHATVEDITVNNVLYVNRDVKAKLKNSVFDDLKSEIPTSVKKLDKVEEVSIDDFINNILPKASNVELLFESSHQNNLMSLIAPTNKDAPSMLKWNSNFSWAYNGDIADSMKQRVKDAGGKVDGVLRFSIQWNNDGKNNSDLDAHCIEPKGNHIYFGSKVNRDTTGNLDVDIRIPNGKVAVENITWLDFDKMLEGKYKFYVENFRSNGHGGFSAEIEYDGQIYSYEYNKNLKTGEKVIVAEVEFSKKNGINFISSLNSTLSSKDIWGIKTNQFHKVSMCMYSPNYWDDQKGIGNKHYFFILNDCKNENSPRGFFNEFLKDDLMKHKKVFEALGSKMRVENSDNQLSGLGFSSTQRNSIIAKVDGNFSRMIKIIF
ncbi:MAG: hypothetical protein AB7V16_07375 [Vulcanibacillus sp.]